MATVARLQAIIDLKNNMSPGLKSASRDIDSMASQGRDKLGRFTTTLGKMWKDAGDQVAQAGEKIRNSGLVMTAAVTVPLAMMTRKIVMAASDLNESLTKSQAIFKEHSAAVEAWANKTASSIGIPKREAMDYVSAFGAMLKSAGMLPEQAKDAGIALTSLSADLASFFNSDIATAMDKLQSGMAGEVRPLREWGVFLSDTLVKSQALAMGYKMVNGQLTDSAKIHARLAIIMKQTTDAHGDFSRTSGFLANQLRVVRAEAIELATKFGQELLPYVLKGVQYLRELMKRFSELEPAQKKVILATAGIVAALGPAMIVFGTISKVVGGLMGIIGSSGSTGIIGAFAKLFSTISASGGVLNALKIGLTALTGPVGIVIAVVSALAFAFATNFAGIRDMILAIWDDMKKWAEGIAGELRAFMAENGDTIRAGWGYIKETIGTALRLIVNIISIAWQIIKTIISVALTIVLGIIRVATKLMHGDWTGAWKAIEETTMKIWLSMTAGISRMAAGLLKTIQDFLQGTINAYHEVEKMFNPNAGDAPKITAFDGWIKALDDTANAADTANNALKGAIGPMKVVLPQGLEAGKPFDYSKFTPDKLAEGMPAKAGKGRKVKDEMSEAEKAMEAYRSAVRDLRKEIELLNATDDYQKKMIELKYEDYWSKIAPTYQDELRNLVHKVLATKKAADSLAFYNDHQADLAKNLSLINAASDEERERLELMSDKVFPNLTKAQQENLLGQIHAIAVARAHVAAVEEQKNRMTEYKQTVAGLNTEFKKLNATTEKEKEIIDFLANDSFQKLSIWLQISLLELKKRNLALAESNQLQTEYKHWVDEIKKSMDILNAASETDRALIELRATDLYNKLGPAYRFIMEAMTRYASKAKEIKEQETQANDAYKKYVQELTQKILELTTANDKLVESEIKKSLAGIRDGEVRKRMVIEIMRLRDQYKHLKEMADLAESVANKMTDAFMNALDKIWTQGFKGFFTNVIAGMRKMLQEIAAEIIRSQIKKAVLGWVGGLLGGVGKGGGNASGGYVYPGQGVRVVGETGPEMFVPTQAGYITPSYRMAGAGGGPSVTVNMTVYAQDAQSFSRSKNQIMEEAYMAGMKAAARDRRL